MAIDLRRNFRGLDLAPPAPENIRVTHRNSACRQVPIDRFLVREHQCFVCPMRYRHDVDVSEFRAGFPPITMSENVMPPHFAARFDFTTRWHGPVEKRVETRDAHAARGRLYVLEESREAPDDFSRIERLRDAEKFVRSEICLSGTRRPG